MYEYIIISNMDDNKYLNFISGEPVNKGDTIEVRESLLYRGNPKHFMRVSNKEIYSCGTVTLYVEEV